MSDKQKQKKGMKKHRQVNPKMAIRITSLVFFVIFIALFVNIATISITGVHLVSRQNISLYASQRDMRSVVLPARRGTIYDVNGEVIAKDTITYNMFAVLNQNRFDHLNNQPAFVTNPEKYADLIAPILGVRPNEILRFLQQDPDVFFQVEFGLAGRHLSQSQKDAIEALALPGIEFEAVTSRFYPNGIFASSTIGYATFDDAKGRMVGRLGIEAMFDDVLAGTDGRREFLVDGQGLVRREIENIAPVDGKDVFLTIDNNIQRIVESNMEQLMQTNPAEFAMAVAVDARTGAILALTNRPTFNPNDLDIRYFTNPFVSLSFEPGSTLKTFTYAAAMDAGVYDGERLFNSARVNIYDNGRPVQTVQNWNNNNWGYISYDEGFMRSSNTGIIHMFEDKLNPDVFIDYMHRFGFFRPTGINIAGEEAGFLVANRLQEIYTTGFGQASAVTPIQLVQAMTAITNEGNMMKPFITSKIVDSSYDNELIESFEPTLVGNPISKETARQMLDLMTRAVEEPEGTGYNTYDVADFLTAGKTGTAQFVVNGRYADCPTCYYNSFLSAAPASNPDVIFYLVTQNERERSVSARSTFTRNVTSNVLAYLNSTPDRNEGNVANNAASVLELDGFVNQSLNFAQARLERQGLDYRVIGGGNRIVGQLPEAFSRISSNQRVFLLTNGSQREMIDLRGFSRSDVQRVAALLNIQVEFNGSGYVDRQSIPVGRLVENDDVLEVRLR